MERNLRNLQRILIAVLVASALILLGFWFLFDVIVGWADNGVPWQAR